MKKKYRTDNTRLSLVSRIILPEFFRNATLRHHQILRTLASRYCCECFDRVWGLRVKKHRMPDQGDTLKLARLVTAGIKVTAVAWACKTIVVDEAGHDDVREGVGRED